MKSLQLFAQSAKDVNSKQALDRNSVGLGNLAGIFCYR